VVKYALVVTYPLDGFNKTSRRDCEKCKVTILSEQKFRNTEIVYTDTSMVVFNTSVPKNSKKGETILTFNSEGNKLFEIKQNDYPNLEMRSKTRI
jgi:hypothetical protein